MKKVYPIFLIIILLIVLVPIKSQADSFVLNVSADKTKVKPGETVNIKLNLSDIKAGDLGINTVEAMLEYDTNIFEEVTQNDIKSVNNWSLTYNNEETAQKGKLLAVKIVAGVTENQDIGTITLKVKNGVKYTKTTIKVKDIASNNGQELIKETDKQIVLEIGEKPQEPSNNNQENTNNNQANTNNNQANKTNTEKKPNNANQQSANMSKGPLPQTGVIDKLIVVGVIALVIIVGVAYIRYKNINK